MDRIFWEYLEELPEQEAAWREWQLRLTNWHRFNTFYTHYLRVDGRRAKLLNCPSPCEQGYPRQVVENSPSDIKAVVPPGYKTSFPVFSLPEYREQYVASPGI